MRSTIISNVQKLLGKGLSWIIDSVVVTLFKFQNASPYVVEVLQNYEKN